MMMMMMVVVERFVARFEPFVERRREETWSHLSSSSLVLYYDYGGGDHLSHGRYWNRMLVMVVGTASWSDQKKEPSRCDTTVAFVVVDVVL